MKRSKFGDGERVIQGIMHDTDNSESRKEKDIRLALLGVVAPLAVQTVLSLLLLRLENSQEGFDVLPLGLLAVALTTIPGFLVLTKGRETSYRLSAAIVYFPLMAVAMFLEVLWLDGRLYGNYF